MMPVIARWIEDRRLAVARGYIPTPKISVQGTGLDLYPFKVVVQFVAKLVSQLGQLRISSQAQLVLKSLGSEEFHPVVVPCIGLWSASDGVLDWETEASTLGLVCHGFCQMHLRQFPAEFLLGCSTSKLQEIHQDVGFKASFCNAHVVHLGHNHSMGVMHGIQPYGLALEHLQSFCTVPACFEEELLPSFRLQHVHGGPR